MRVHGKRSVRDSTSDTIASLAFAACQTGWVVRGRMFGGTSVLAAILSGVFLLAGCSQPRHTEISPPPGYRAIADSEYSDDWQRVADLFPTPDRAEGDFDGDSMLDQARVWVRENGDGWVLMAYLSNTRDRPVLLHESDSPLGRRPIRTIRPGEHKTHRFFGIGPGGPDTTAVVHLIHDAINLGYTESEGTTYIWNPDTSEFDLVAMY